MDQLPGIIYDAATRLFGCAKVHASYVFKLEENQASLKNKWDDLQNIYKDVQRRIDDAESMGEMQRTNEVNGWLQKVQNLQKETVDILNSQDTHKKYLSGCCPKNCMSTYKLGKKVVKMLSEANELMTSGKSFDKNVNIAYKLPFRQVTEMPSVETIGLDLMLNKVWVSLEDENVGIIGLYGMGGAGKTTLMKKINNEFRNRKHDFAVVLWVVVSRDGDINKIMNDIRNKLGVNDDIWHKCSQDDKVAKIYQVLKQKKFVLMLDDLWGNLELEMVGVPHPKDTNNQSKVLFTTRNEDVCTKMQAQKKFKVECLLEQEAFDLFCKKVGEETLKCHREIPKLAWEMAKECGGLPLALITVGSAMAGVKNVNAWRQAKSDLRSSPFIGSDMEEKVFSIIKFSYDRMPDEAHKKCFLYCALYPEDYEVRVEDLIYRWIGEGFLGKYKSKKSIREMYLEGESIIEKLRLSCLLEGVERLRAEELWYAIKMHDVIRDMALWLARDQDVNKDKVLLEREALATSEMDSERLSIVERVSIIEANGSWEVPACPNLLTLRVGESVHITDCSNLRSMTRLKVLDLSYYMYVPGHDYLATEIGKLTNLEFLNLSGVIIGWPPIALKNLKRLRVLLMEVTGHLEILHLGGIESLQRLKVLRFYSEGLYSSSRLRLLGVTVSEEEFLEKLESLLELEELCIQLGTITGVQKLLESTRLRDCLRHVVLHGIEDQLKMPSFLASLSRMKHLECMELLFLRNIMEGSSVIDTCDLRKLRLVHIAGCPSITHLTWLKYAPLLEILRVYDCELIEELAKGSEDVDGGTDIDNADDIFSCLKLLYLSLLPKLKSIHKRALAFPLLKSIFICGCPNLRKLPFTSNSAKDSLITIGGDSTEWWDNLEWEEDTATKDFLLSKYRGGWY